MLDFLTRPKTPEQRQARARASIRRAVWYLILLVIFILLIVKPQLVTRFIR